jgi:uncharacterized protein YcfL
MIDTTALNKGNIVTGIIMAVLFGVCAVALLVFVSGSSSESAAGTEAKSQPYEIGEKDATTGIASVTLTEKAAERAGIETAAVEDVAAGILAVPYSAIWYDAKGNAFVYTVTAPLSYIRVPITVDHVEGDQAILSAGPSAGTEVVTQGVAELYGAETGLK